MINPRYPCPLSFGTTFEMNKKIDEVVEKNGGSKASFVRGVLAEILYDDQFDYKGLFKRLREKIKEEDKIWMDTLRRGR